MWHTCSFWFKTEVLLIGLSGILIEDFGHTSQCGIHGSFWFKTEVLLIGLSGILIEDFGHTSQCGIHVLFWPRLRSCS